MNKVLDLISNQCESCRLREKCIEDECVLYQIEQITINQDRLFNKVITEDMKPVEFTILPRGYGKKVYKMKTIKVKELLRRMENKETLPKKVMFGGREYKLIVLADGVAVDYATDNHFLMEDMSKNLFLVNIIEINLEIEEDLDERNDI